MIGVAIPLVQQEAAREFFELCKTPWRFWEADADYDVVVCAGESAAVTNGKLILVYGSSIKELQSNQHSIHSRAHSNVMLSYESQRLPIYGRCITYSGSSIKFAIEDATGDSVIRAERIGDRTVVHVGYDLFIETHTLLTVGQPLKNASCPALELHITLFRELITRSGFSFLEIPPVPDGHAFVACLTHDVDHPLLRNHSCDRTMLGFLYRATVGSFLKLCLKRISLGNLWRNWMAAAKLPFVYFGMAEDYWLNFDRYLEIEAGRPSTFFVIPNPDVPGRQKFGSAPSARACRYSLSELLPVLNRITNAGNEVAVHGIDSWLNTSSGQRERAEVARIKGSNDGGIRMHWLYYDENSPSALDAAGFVYDSTVGYNETVGYRAGTTQVFRPIGTKTLLELPLHVMDTSLFYPDHLNLNEGDAYRIVAALMENAERFGGAFTVNWHDRSIAPERLWGAFYKRIVDELQGRHAWFATARQAVAWFEKRRAVVFDSIQAGSKTIDIRVSLSVVDSTLPGLKVRVHKPRLVDATEPLSSGCDRGFVDIPLRNTTTIPLHYDSE